MPACYYHPDRETLVSCGRCGHPLCPDCVMHGATGVRCRECLKMSRHARGLATPSQLARGLGLALLVSLAIGAICGLLHWVDLFSGLLLGLIVGTVAYLGTRRHSELTIQAFAIGAALLGVAAGALVMAAILSKGNLQAVGPFFSHSYQMLARPAAAAAVGVILRFRI